MAKRRSRRLTHCPKVETHRIKVVRASKIIFDWLGRSRRNRDLLVDDALIEIRSFFSLVLYGYRSMNKRENFLIALSSMRIARSVLKEINNESPTIGEVRNVAKKFLWIVENLQAHRPISFPGPELGGLQIFLSVLHRREKRDESASIWL